VSERLFNLAVLAITVALLLVVNAAFVAGVIDSGTNTLVTGLVLGGGAGVAAGNVRGGRQGQPPPE